MPSTVSKTPSKTPSGQQLASLIAKVLSTAPTGNGVAVSTADAASSPAVRYAGELVGAIQKSAMLAPKLVATSTAKTAAKDFVSGDTADPKDWFSDAFNIVQQVAPYVVDLFGKDYTDAGNAIQAAGVSQARLQDKDFLSFVGQALLQIAPDVLDMFQQGKDFNPGAAPQLPDVPASVAEADKKDWFSDALHVVSTALPYVIQAVAAVA